MHDVASGFLAFLAAAVAAALCLPSIPKVRALIMSLRLQEGKAGGAHELMSSRRGHSTNGQRDRKIK